jgi:hypothetical protein
VIVVADASVLVGELLRKRGRELVLHPDLHIVVAEHQWEETEHELSRRLGILESNGRLTAEQRLSLEQAVSGLVDTSHRGRPPGDIRIAGRDGDWAHPA